MVKRRDSGFVIRVFSDENDLVRAVADRIGALAQARRSAGRPLVLGLAAGASPRGVYRALGDGVRGGRLDLTGCVAFGLDEYYPIDPRDPRSLATQLSDIAAELGIAEGGLHVLRGDIPRDRKASRCRRYEDEIRRAGGIDFQILGIGRSGHIGFNEPGAPRESRTRAVRLDERTRQDAAPAFGGLDHVPREALTMGVATILEAREIALIALGEAKAAIVRQAFSGTVTSGVPASYLQGCDRATVYLDKAAAAGLDRSNGV